MNPTSRLRYRLTMLLINYLFKTTMPGHENGFEMKIVVINIRMFISVVNKPAPILYIPTPSAIIC
ncbi:hypothetical protein BA6E_121620 [Bacteroidales bacterium 6E]|nr:hypothetical protein BA6E_121620 [Bacteroidales bacterium 6E]